MLCVVPSLLYFLCYGFRASQWHWAQAAAQKQCGLRPGLGVLCATNHRVTQNNRWNFGGLQPITEHPQSKAVLQHLYNWKWSQGHTGCVFSFEQCRIYHSFERLDLQSSKVPLYFRESTSLLQQKSVIVGEWKSSFLKFSLFLRNLTNWICSNFFRTIYKANDDKTDFFFFFCKRLRRKKLLYSLGIKNRVWLLVSFSCINLLFLSSTMSNVKSKWNGGIYVFHLKGLA